MLSRSFVIALALGCAVGSHLVGSKPLQAQNAYRGTNPGWPAYSNGYYAAYQPYGMTQPHTTARPIIPVVPVTAAYANPNYYGAYSAGYRGAAQPAAYGMQPTGYGVQPTGYGVQAGYGGQPTAAYYAPPTAVQYAPQYAPQQSYAVSPSGSSYAGSEAATFYGQPTAVNYMAPRVAYRPAYAQVPVYSYRPVTTYYAGQMQSCQQPAPPVSSCQPTTSRCGGFLSWLNPFNHRWLKHNWFGHGGGGCGSPPPTTAYCGQTYAPQTAYCGQPVAVAAPQNCYSVNQCGAPAGCGQQPYYPAPTNVIPFVPSTPGTTIIPAQPTIRSPIIGTPTVPPPPTRIIPGTTLAPADTQPSLPRGTIINPGTGGSFPTGPSSIAPGTTITPAPGSSFGTPPAGGGSFGSGTNYPPPVDPYSSSTGSFSTNGASTTRDIRREPALAPGVQIVPDPDANQPNTNNRAPKLIDPRDKMASPRLSSKWAVVPAVWPRPAGSVSPYSQPIAATDSTPRDYQPVRDFEPAVTEADYDDSGWRSGR